MKIKIGKQQIEYLNELPTREMKIEFLLDHVLLILEASLDKKVSVFDGSKITRFDDESPKRNFTIGEIVDKVAELSVDKIEKENLLKFDLPKGNQNKIFKEQYPVSNDGKPMVDVTGMQVPLNHESLSKEQLNEITKPKYGLDYVVEYLGRSREDEQERFLEEVKEMSKHFNVKILCELPVEKQPRYTKEDLEFIYHKARIKNFNGNYFYKNFEKVFEVFNKISPNK